MACMDFMPAATSSGGFFSSPVYATFSSLLDSANQWLAQNPTARVLSCETLAVKGLHGSTYEFHSEYSMTTDHYVRRSGKSSHTYGATELKALRVWYLPDNAGPAQRLAYRTLVPNPVGSSGKPEYEDFQTTMQRYNQQVAYTQPPGVILNIERVIQRCGTSGRMEDERTCYQHKQYGLNLIRIWFLVGQRSPPEEIGCADFLPQRATGDQLLDSVGTVFRQAAAWCQRQSGVRVTNVQSLHFKVKDVVDSQRPISHYWIRTELVQFVRVWFVKPLTDVPMPPPPSLTYMTFEPAKARTGGARELKFETIHQLSQRIYTWLIQCGGRIIDIQTVPVPCKFGSAHYPAEQSNHKLKMNTKFHIRIFFDGEFRPPWAGAIAEPPPITDAGCTLL